MIEASETRIRFFCGDCQEAWHRNMAPRDATLAKRAGTEKCPNCGIPSTSGAPDPKGVDQ